MSETATTKKYYLDLGGLQKYDGLIKKYITDNDLVITGTLAVGDYKTIKALSDAIKALEDSDLVYDANYVHTDNNFTDTLKNKLDGIAEGAEVNVQSDWAETDENSDAFIKNKPTDLVRNSLTIAGVDLKDNITKDELLTALNVTEDADPNVIESISVNGVDATISNKKASVTIPEATTSASGVMSAADKTKLDGIDAGAEVNYISSVGDNLDVDSNGKLTVSIPEATVTGVNTTTVNGLKLELTDKKVTLVDDGLTTTLAGKTVTVEKATGTTDDQHVYVIKQGGEVVGTINHPKELVVTSGEVITAADNDATNNLEKGKKYLKLTIANQTAPVYIAVHDLVDLYTPGNGISINDTNVVSVKISNATKDAVTLSATANGLSATLDGWDDVKDTVDSLTRIDESDIEGLFSE